MNKLLLCLVVIFLLVVVMMVFVYDYYGAGYYTLNYKDDSYLATLDKNYSSKKKLDYPFPVIISLTTLPKRIDKMMPTIMSLLSQSVRVDEIRVNVPYKTLKGEDYTIPAWLKALKHVKVVRCKDYGPSTKLLQSLVDYNYCPEAIIVIVDDDIIYTENNVEQLVHNCISRDQAITFIGYKYSDRTSNTLNKLLSQRYCHSLMGVCGSAIKVKMLHPRVFDYRNGPSQALFVDDDWISGWILAAGYKIFSLGLLPKTGMIPNIHQNNKISLSSTINKDKENMRIVGQWFMDNYSINYSGR